MPADDRNTVAEVPRRRRESRPRRACWSTGADGRDEEATTRRAMFFAGGDQGLGIADATSICAHRSIVERRPVRGGSLDACRSGANAPARQVRAAAAHDSVPVTAHPRSGDLLRGSGPHAPIAASSRRSSGPSTAAPCACRLRPARQCGAGIDPMIVHSSHISYRHESPLNNTATAPGLGPFPSGRDRRQGAGAWRGGRSR